MFGRRTRETAARREAELQKLIEELRADAVRQREEFTRERESAVARAASSEKVAALDLILGKGVAFITSVMDKAEQIVASGDRREAERVTRAAELRASQRERGMRRMANGRDPQGRLLPNPRLDPRECPWCLDPIGGQGRHDLMGQHIREGHRAARAN
jgi:hypothetical protein